MYYKNDVNLWYKTNLIILYTDRGEKFMEKINCKFDAYNDFNSICIHLSRFLYSMGKYDLASQFLNLIDEKTEAVQFLIAVNKYK